MLPLYKLSEKPGKSQETNSGLWFERFYNQFKPDASAIFKAEENREEQGNNFWLQQFKHAGNTEALQVAACQQMQLVKSLDGKHKFFNSQWHFVTGTGYPHPVENGMLWHPVHGVPYLSGAAVKGLVRAWVEQWEFADIKDEAARQAKIRERSLNWFGSDHKDPKKQEQTAQVGDIIFFDALPVKAVSLKTDIMTPHYGNWYSEGGNIEDVANEPEKIPADWHDPIPIPFLVVDKTTSFLFSIAPRHAGVSSSTVDEVLQCLVQALEWLGAGAKTATGYGGFIEYNDPLDKKWKEDNQSIDEEIKAWTEKQLCDAFSRDYTKTKAHFEQKGHDWHKLIALVWHYHEATIISWENTKDKNPGKAYKKLMADR
jgi:CRISPR-associated protein Cmr6